MPTERVKFNKRKHKIQPWMNNVLLKKINKKNVYAQLLKKKSVRAITFSEYLAPSEPIFQTLNVLNFENLVIQRISLLMFKYSHGDVPVSVSQLFRTNNKYHDYNTRNCARIHAPVGTTEASYRTFGYRGIHIWNHISQKINTNTSYPCFKKNVKICIQNNNLDNLRLNY